MAKREVTLDLLTENGKQIFNESGNSFLIVKRSWIEISIEGGGGGGRFIEYDWTQDRYVSLENKPQKIKIIVYFGDKKWENIYEIKDFSTAVKVMTTLRNIKNKMDGVRVISILNRIYTQTINVLARKK